MYEYNSVLDIVQIKKYEKDNLRFGHNTSDSSRCLVNLNDISRWES